jgi:hypothetical protein
MLGHGLPCHVQVLAKLSYGLTAVPMQLIEQFSAARIGERFEHFVYRAGYSLRLIRNLTFWLHAKRPFPPQPHQRADTFSGAHARRLWRSSHYSDKTSDESQSTGGDACPVKITPADEKRPKLSRRYLAALNQGIVDGFNHNQRERNDAADEHCSN